MESGITGVDHAIIAVPDLEAARMQWTRLGFTVGPRGRHLGLGTGNYCIMFERDYIELLGVVDPGLEFGSMAGMLRSGREGLVGLAWATDNVDFAAAAVAQLGFETAPPQDLARQFELEEGSDLLRFRGVALPDAVLPALPSLVCQHLTPEKLRLPVWTAHPNGVTGLLGITVIVDETGPLIAACERIFGNARLTLTDDVLVLHIGVHRVLFTTLEDFCVLHPEANVVDTILPLPFPAAITLLTRDAAASADYLADWQIGFVETPDGSLVIPPWEASGVVLELVPRRG
jgi:catechol 2,3-dioxygenase-like lactoylglutathione lyase family enzyme